MTGYCYIPQLRAVRLSAMYLLVKEIESIVYCTSFYTLCFIDGSKIAKATTIDLLLQDDFDLVINSRKFSVSSPKVGKSVFHYKPGFY